MTTEEKLGLFDELIVKAGIFCTVADNYGVVLNPDFDQRVRPQLDAVRDVLERCPQPRSVWDGTFRDEDCTIEIYQSESNRHRGLGAQAVKMTHSITGLVRISESKPSRTENQRVARDALRIAVAKRYSEMQR